MSSLALIKLVHTIVWAFLACAIAVLPYLMLRRPRLAKWLLAILLIESLVVTINGMRCPLTNLAARYTTEQRANFDIYLPIWLAKYNVVIFGAWFAADLLFAAVVFWRRFSIETPSRLTSKNQQLRSYHSSSR
jgi:hypothetical protein